MPEKILVIDDDSEMLLVLLGVLKKKGYEVYGGKDGQEALALAGQLAPDLLILDLYLPRLNGDDVVRAMKKDPALAGIPVLIISSEQERLEQIAKECGADSFLRKPFGFQELLASVRALVSRRAGKDKA